MSTEPSRQAAAENLLLAQLPVHERNAVLRGSEAVTCASGEVLLSANTHSDYVFFPLDAVVAMVRTVRNGQGVDVGVVGSEGMIGLDVFVDAKTQLDDAVVRSPGTVYCMRADELRRQFHRGGGLQKYLLRFTNAFLSQVAQIALCNRFHTLDARLSRWLLMIHDRSSLPEIGGTPNSISPTPSVS
jgi:CRP-like cAMP-binding protein